MTAALDKLADDAAAAVLDVIEEERRINKSDIAAAIKKTIKPLIEKPALYGGFGVGGFMTFGDSVHVYRAAHAEYPLLPED